MKSNDDSFRLNVNLAERERMKAKLRRMLGVESSRLGQLLACLRSSHSSIGSRLADCRSNESQAARSLPVKNVHNTANFIGSRTAQRRLADLLKNGKLGHRISMGGPNGGGAEEFGRPHDVFLPESMPPQSYFEMDRRSMDESEVQHKSRVMTRGQPGSSQTRVGSRSQPAFNPTGW